jgi:hypothetical protein
MKTLIEIYLVQNWKCGFKVFFNLDIMLDVFLDMLQHLLDT